MSTEIESEDTDSADDIEHYLKQVEAEIAWIRDALEAGNADALRSHFGELESWVQGGLAQAIEDHAESIE
jgi:hypothetical protein